MSKAAKKRECPAVGHPISAAECGSNRISRHACPADCLYLPFSPANYSQLLELEGKLDDQCKLHLLETATDRKAMERALQKARVASSAHALHAWHEWNLFFDRGTDGKTCAERWVESSAADLKNDELVLLRAKMQTRVVLLEIHRVLDLESVEAVDLFAADGTPAMRLRDRSAAAMASRFSTLLTWIYPLPHYWRLSGTAIVMAEQANFEPREIVKEIVSHLGGPVTEMELRRWLAENFVRFNEAYTATCRMNRMRMFTGMDAKWGRAVYELQAPFAECRERLETSPEVDADDLSPAERQEGFAEAGVWLSEIPDDKLTLPSGGQSVIGRVLLGQAHWRLEAFGEERLVRLRRQFEELMGARARFTGERLDDLGAGMAAKEPPVDESLVPPRLLEQPRQFLLTSSRIPALRGSVSLKQTEAEMFQAADRQFLDESVPALDNHTPREAARNPALRPCLIRLLKERVRNQDERNREKRRNDDINWMLRELGADEIIFDPPPPRPPIKRADSIEPELEEDMFSGGLDFPPPPPLNDEPLSMEEISLRIEEGMNMFATAAETEEFLAAKGLTILDDADKLTLEQLNDDEFALAIPFILQAALALIPPGHRAPVTNYELLKRGFVQNSKALLKHLETPETLMGFFLDTPQPHLMTLLVTEIMRVSTSGPKKYRPSRDAQPVILTLVKSVVEELDRALRA